VQYVYLCVQNSVLYEQGMRIECCSWYSLWKQISSIEDNKEWMW